MTKCHRCGIRMGDARCGTDITEVNFLKKDKNELPPLCFFKYNGWDVCSACYMGMQNQELDQRSKELQENDNRDWLNWGKRR